MMGTAPCDDPSTEPERRPHSQPPAPADDTGLARIGRLAARQSSPPCARPPGRGLGAAPPPLRGRMTSRTRPPGFPNVKAQT